MAIPKTRKRAKTRRDGRSRRTTQQRERAPAIDVDDDVASTPPESVLALIRDLQAGRLAPQSLSVDSRRACVEHLTADGFSVAEIAQVLQSSDRTIARDRAALRFAHSVEASPELTRQMVGHLMREAEITVNRLRRFARGTETDVAQKIEAEKASWIVTRDMLQMLQRLGYLPSAPTLINGQIMHHAPDVGSSTEELQREITRIEQICLADSHVAADSPSIRMIKKVKSTARELARHQREFLPNVSKEPK